MSMFSLPLLEACQAMPHTHTSPPLKFNMEPNNQPPWKRRFHPPQKKPSMFRFPWFSKKIDDFVGVSYIVHVLQATFALQDVRFARFDHQGFTTGSHSIEGSCIDRTLQHLTVGLESHWVRAGGPKRDSSWVGLVSIN